MEESDDVTVTVKTLEAREVRLPYVDANEIHGRTTEENASAATKRL